MALNPSNTNNLDQLELKGLIWQHICLNRGITMTLSHTTHWVIATINCSPIIHVDVLQLNKWWWWWWHFRSKELKVDDIRSSGSKSGIYRCPYCPYTNANPKLVHGHKIMHSAPQLKCSYCGHLDHFPSRMMRHMRRRHRGMTAKYVRLGGSQTDDSTSSSKHSTTTEDDAADGKCVTAAL